MPKIVDRTEQCRVIRRAAREVFASRGLEGTGLGHVADAAGMGRSSLYHYYADKNSLVRDVALDLLREEEAIFRAAADADGPALDRILQLTEILAGLYSEWRSAGRMILQLWATETEQFGGALRSIRRDLAVVIAAGHADGSISKALDADLTATIVIGLLDGVLIQCFVDPETFTDDAVIRDAVVRSVAKVLAP